MIPFVLLKNNNEILDFISIHIRWIKIKRCRRNKNFQEVIHIMTGFLNMMIQLMQLTNLIMRLIHIRKKKKKLFKPHLLLQFLGGYRLINKISSCLRFTFILFFNQVKLYESIYIIISQRPTWTQRCLDISEK